MLDTLIQICPKGPGCEQAASLALGVAGSGGLIGKIVWDWLKSPRKLAEDIGMLKTDVAVIKTNMDWLINDYKKRNGEV